jgi:hypothetical protein
MPFLTDLQALKQTVKQQFHFAIASRLFFKDKYLSFKQQVQRNY